MAPPANNLIILGTSIRSFRNLECQTPSVISESIGIPYGSKKNGEKSEESEESEERNLIHIEEDDIEMILCL